MSRRKEVYLTIERLTEAFGDRFRFERDLGRGGAARVCLAEELSHDMPGRVRATAGDVVELALASAIITAGAHAAVLGVRQHVLHGFTQAAYEFVWVVPISYSVLFLFAGVPLWVAARSTPLLSRRVVAGAFAALAVFALLLLYRGIHPAADLLLAVGAGVQVAQRAGLRWEAWRRGLARVAAMAGAGLAVVTGYKTLTPRVQEARAIASDRTAAAGAPNVILLILDTVRASSLGLYGHARPTSPVIDRLATEGTTFDHAFSPAAWTLASHSSMLTGRWAHETKASYSRSSDPALPNIARALRARGYVTAAFMANAGWAGHESGFTGGFLRYEGHPMDLSQFLWSPTLTQMPLTRELIGGLASGAPERIVGALRAFDLRIDVPPVPRTRNANEIADRFLSWHRRVGTRHPYFAMLNMLDAHEPYEPPEPYRSRFDGGRTKLDRYDGAIAFMDSIVGTIDRELREAGELDRTILIVTADHGETFGEKGLHGHGASLYEPVVHVPLVVRFPGRVAAGVRRDEAVSLRNIAATILHLVDGRPSSDLPGHSLFGDHTPGADAEPLRLLVNQAVNRPGQPNADGPIYGVVTDSVKYIRFMSRGAEELYAWRRDPGEAVNLADSASARTVRDAGRALVAGMANR